MTVVVEDELVGDEEVDTVLAAVTVSVDSNESKDDSGAPGMTLIGARLVEELVVETAELLAAEVEDTVDEDPAEGAVGFGSKVKLDKPSVTLRALLTAPVATDEELEVDGPAGLPAKSTPGLVLAVVMLLLK